MLILAGFLLTLLMFALATYGYLFFLYPSIYYFIDLPSFLFVAIPLVFFLCVTKSGGIIYGYIRSSFKRGYEYTKAELESIVTAIKSAIKVTLAAGGFSFIVGAIVILAYVDMQDGASLWLARNMAVILISPIYSIAISFFIFFPVQAWAENKIKSDF